MAVLSARDHEEGKEDIRQAVKESLKHRVMHDFTYHAPKGNQPERYTKIREKAREFALLLVDLTPASREQSLAITQLEQAVFYANAAIARNE